MQLDNRGTTLRGVHLIVLAGLLALSSFGTDGCGVRIGPPPPPPGAGQPAPPGTPGAPGTINPPQVAILVSTTTEVAGYAVDTANLTNSAITVELLPATAGVSGTAVAPLASTTANVSDGIPGLTYPGHGFRFPAPAVTVGMQVIARANNSGQIGTSPSATITGPTGTVTTTGNTTPTGP